MNMIADESILTSSKIEDCNDILAALDHAAEQATNYLETDGVLISFLKLDTLYSLGAFPPVGSIFQQRKHKASDTICAHTAESGAMISVEDARSDRVLSASEYVRSGMILGYLGYPIYLPETGTIGALCAYSSTPRKWTGFEKQYLRLLTANIELLMLKMLGRLEVDGLSQEISELDKLIAAISTSLSVLVSIYSSDGTLLFISSALANKVDANVYSDFWKEYASDQSEFVVSEEETGSGTSFRVSCHQTASGLAVCTWQPQGISLTVSSSN